MRRALAAPASCVLLAVVAFQGSASAQTRDSGDGRPLDRSEAESTSEETQSVWSFADDEALRTIDGVEFGRGDLEGRYVLLDFWATWCTPCLDELPTLKQVRSSWSEKQLLIVGVSANQTDRRTLKSWLDRHDVSWPQIHDGRGMKGALAQRFGVEALPRTVLIDRRGLVVAVDLRGADLVGTLDVLLE